MNRTLPPMIRTALAVIILTILAAAVWAVSHPARPTAPDAPRNRVTVQHSTTGLQLPTLTTGN